MVQFNPNILNRYLAPDISKFTACDAPDISMRHSQAQHWLRNHFYNSIFLNGDYNSKFHQYDINLLYRAQVAFADYEEAKSLTNECLALGSADNPAIRVYFRALARWESCLLNLQIFVEVMNKMNKEYKGSLVYSGKDGTPPQRVCEIANTIKHFGRNTNEDTVPMWLSNLGFNTRLHKLTYKELAELLYEIALLADELQNPSSFAKSKT